MKHLVYALALSSGLLICANTFGAGNSEKSCHQLLQAPNEELLENLSTQVIGTPTLPNGSLVYLNRIEGFDPFGYFLEGMENENPLSISNEKEGLRISVGGSLFENGVDGDVKTKITALKFSSKAQRYLITLEVEDEVIDFLINVDRLSRHAYVWMREETRRNGKSDWELAVTYGPGAPPPPGQSSRPDASQEDVKPKASVLPKLEFEGLIGEGRESSAAQLAKIINSDRGPMLIVYSGGHELTGFAAAIIISEEIYRAIGNGDIKALDKKSAEGEDGKVSFRIDGYDYQGQPRIGIKIEKYDGDTIEISGCNPYKPNRVSLY